MLHLTGIECVGYAYQQCITSGISISRESEAEELKELQELVTCYETYLEVLDEGDEDKIKWSISFDERKKILAAKTLEEATKCIK